MKIILAGEGAIGRKHIAALQRIDDVEVVAIVGGLADDTEAFADEFGIERWTTDLAEALALDADAAILATPTQMHAAQAIQTMRAGKHVLVEIPMADNLADSSELVRTQQETGGKPRTWTDHLLWHHSCHTVDLFGYQTGELITSGWAQQGPTHPELGIAMDMTIGMSVPSGALCTLSLSFNNNGPLGTFFRYICDNGTYIARYDDLVDGYDNPVDLSGVAISSDGIELQDREFISAITEGREPNASVAQCLGAMETIDMLEKTIAEH